MVLIARFSIVDWSWIPTRLSWSLLTQLIRRFKNCIWSTILCKYKLYGQFFWFFLNIQLFSILSLTLERFLFISFLLFHSAFSLPPFSLFLFITLYVQSLICHRDLLPFLSSNITGIKMHDMRRTCQFSLYVKRFLISFSLFIFIIHYIFLFSLSLTRVY